MRGSFPLMGRWALLAALGAVAAWQAQAQVVTLPAGTELQISLETRLNTKESKAGDPFRSHLVLPVFAEDREVLPMGTIVEGVVVRVQGPGRVSGKAEMQLRPEKVTLPNGDSMPLTAAVTGGAGNENTKVDSDGEGTIQGSGKDAPSIRGTAGAVTTGTIMGAVIGNQAGATGTGALIGAGAVAAAVLLNQLFKKGNDAELPAGSELLLQLNRPLEFNPTMKEVSPEDVKDEPAPSRRLRIEERRPELTREQP